MIQSARVICERICVLMKALFCCHTLCIARKGDKIRAQIVSKAPTAIDSAFTKEERKMSKQRVSTRTMAVIGMFTAVSFIAVLIGRIVPNVAGFLSYDPKDAVVVIAGFILGPLASVAISVIVSFIEMITISATGPYGFIMNIVSTCAFAVPAAWFYRRHHSQKGAVLGLSLGVLVLVICMVIWNYVVTPFYMGVPRAVVAGMLTTVFAPFNLAKGGINAALSLLLYRPIVSSLRKAGLVAESSSGHKKTFNTGFTLFAGAVLVTFVLLLMALMGIL